MNIDDLVSPAVYILMIVIIICMFVLLTSKAAYDRPSLGQLACERNYGKGYQYNAGFGPDQCVAPDGTIKGFRR